MVEWWNGYDQPVCAQRLRVIKVCKTFTDEDRKRIHVYMHSRLRAFDTSATGQASTSTTPPVPVFQAVLDLEENDPLYRAFAFPMQAPPRGASRPQRVVRETLLPSNREGRRGREHAEQVGALVDICDDEMIEVAPVDPQAAEDVPEEEHPDHSLVRLPTEAELDKGYVFGRDCHCKVVVSKVEEPLGPLTNQRVMNIDHSFHIYELIEGEAHKDVSTITLRPMLYRDTSGGVEGAEPIMFDGEGNCTLFLETVNAWMVKHGFSPEVDLVRKLLLIFMEGVT